MNTIPSTKDLYLYTGSTFDGQIVIKDIHGEPYLISDGDEITFFIKNSDKASAEETIQIILTCDNEIMGEYPFKLSPETTEKLSGNYEYYAFIHFADGDKYQIVPNTPLKARIPHGVLSYYENKNRIIAQVPRVMTASEYLPALNELEEFIASVDSTENTHLIRMRNINGADIILIGNTDTMNSATPLEFIEQINRKAEYLGIEEPYVSGFFHIDEIPEQMEYYTAAKNTFGDKFIDIEKILKTPVLSKHSGMIVSSIAFDLLKQKPTSNDIMSITHNEYPECIKSDETHFNDKGCYAAAKVLLKEVYKIG